MSTISEIDIRDWEQVDFQLIQSPLAKNSRYPDDVYEKWKEFQEQVETLRDKQIKEATKNVAALFKPKE